MISLLTLIPASNRLCFCGVYLSVCLQNKQGLGEIFRKFRRWYKQQILVVIHVTVRIQEFKKDFIIHKQCLEVLGLGIGLHSRSASV